MRVVRFFRFLTVSWLAGILSAGCGASAADRDSFRFYISPRAGGASFSDGDSAGVVTLENPSQYPFPQFTIGANINRYLGAELAIDYAETNIAIPDHADRIAEYATWAFLAQARLRYPLLDDRLVPYVVAGAGIGFGELNDRNVTVTDVSIAGRLDDSFVMSAGVGVEYFIADNLAFLIEAKHRFLYETDIEFQHQKSAFDLDSTLFSAGLRVFFDGPGDKKTEPKITPESGGPGARPRRGYLIFHGGGAFFPNANESGSLKIDGPTHIWFSTGLGLEVTDHWGAEIIGDFYEPTVSTPEHGVVLEHTLWTLLGHVRYRYPLRDDRLVPYVVAGGGLGVMQLNDRRIPHNEAPVVARSEMMPIASIGAGVDYFVSDNIAVGAQARYLFHFMGDTTIAGQTVEIDNQTMLLTAGVRIFFP